MQIKTSNAASILAVLEFFLLSSSIAMKAWPAPAHLAKAVESEFSSLYRANFAH